MANAAPWIGMGVSALGSVASARAANKQRPVHPDQMIPSDIKMLRSRLASLFQDDDLFGGMDDPITGAARSATLDLISPEYRDQYLSGAGAFDAIAGIRDARMPAFQDSLRDMFALAGSQIGAQGHRVSSNRERMMFDTGARAVRGFESDLAGLFPGIMSAQLGGIGTIGSLAGQLATQRLAEQVEPLRLATQFATSYPGGGNFNPAGGNSVFGTGLGAAGQGAMLLGLMSQFKDDDVKTGVSI